ncbi:MAG: DUF998 domain-containing protein [Bacteroidota bacterium]
MKTARFNMIKIAAIVCIVTCFFDFAILYLLGSYYSGYSHLKDTMSSLGSDGSPVSNTISIWWILIGFVFIFFGFMFRRAFDANLRSVKLASVLIMLYGFGEGIGSGIFKANRIGGQMTQSLILHDVFGGVGVISILILPLVMLRIIINKKMPRFYFLSKVIFVVGILSMLLFVGRFSPDEFSLIARYKGLWQRIFLFNTYVYFISISIIMYTENKSQDY